MQQIDIYIYIYIDLALEARPRVTTRSSKHKYIVVDRSQTSPIDHLS
jgi:hypothetical protein